MIVCGKVKREYIFAGFNTTFFDPQNNMITVFARYAISISRCQTVDEYGSTNFPNSGTYMLPSVRRIIGDSCKSVGSARNYIQIHFHSRLSLSLWSRETRTCFVAEGRGGWRIGFHQLYWLFMEIHTHSFSRESNGGFVVLQMLNRQICLSLSGIIAIVCILHSRHYL